MDATTPLTTTEGLKAGDVLNVAVKLKDKSNGQDFWWRRFVIIADVVNRRQAITVTLKMNPTDKDVRDLDFRQDERQVITFLPENQHPQGVVAMRMKMLMKGIIKLEHE